ncbi:hypothetical protein [Clostridium tarantellae]|uniref:Uncharacterized protein n=1 Tax=Clostridium tarantellae TaxID=39493 RepID=A0A6I1MKJ5_9CLOT|nr:hypothetical protein [Clostridium tarantellae]MPQ44056.1 hypothetical protein [Clostridium tarantellae]
MENNKLKIKRKIKNMHYGKPLTKKKLMIKKKKSLNFSLVNEYKGLKVIRNINRITRVKYYTILNPKNNSHIHVQGKNIAYRVCDCYKDLIEERDIIKYNKYYRKCALGLMGYNIKCKTSSTGRGVAILH